MSGRLRTWVRWTLIIAGVAVAYLASGRALVALSAPPNGAVSAVWLPAGISVAAMIVFGPFTAVGSFLGSLAFELTAGTPAIGAVGVALGNAIGDLVVYFLIVGFARQAKRRFSLETATGVARFLAAAAAGSLLSATIGVSDYVLVGVLKAAVFWPNWLTFFGSGVMGVVLITPMLVYVIRDRGFLHGWSRTVAFAVGLAAIAVAAWLWEGPLLPDGAQDSALIIGILLLLLLAFRYKVPSMAVAVVVFSAAAIWGSVQSLSAQSGLPGFGVLFALQFTTCAVASIGFGVSAILAERNKADEDLRLAATVFESSNEGVVITLPDGTIVDVNDAFMRLHGVTRDEVLGANPRVFKSERQSRAFWKEMWGSLVKTGEWSGEVWDRRADGSVFLKRLAITAVTDAHGKTTHYVGTFSDITAAKEAEDRLAHAATHDALTSLANRALLDAELVHAIARARRSGARVAVGFIDLDHFKAVNDTLGHLQGDEMLIEVAGRLTSVVRDGDIVARQGGDEFIIVAPDLATTYDLAALADRLLAALRVPYDLAGQQTPASASLGLAIFPADGDAGEDLVRNADVALYQAKELGRDRAQFFSPESEAGPA